MLNAERYQPLCSQMICVKHHLGCFFVKRFLECWNDDGLPCDGPGVTLMIGVQHELSRAKVSEPNVRLLA